MPDGAGEDGSGGLHAHVGVVAHPIDATFLGGLLGLRSILVLSDDVSAQIEEPFGGLLLLHGVEPGVGPDDVHLGAGISLPHAEGEGVDAAQDLGDREGGHVADHVRLGHLARHESRQIARLVHAPEVGGGVLGGFVAGAVLEDHIGELSGYGHGGIHEAEAGGEDNVVALLCEVADDALGVGAFGYVLDVGGLNA